ncbi:MAG: Primosomal protein N' [Phycisphaerae bacterium]|nr:Primosomal protein N' [Phycisphaerae bacterium]
MHARGSESPSGWLWSESPQQDRTGVVAEVAPIVPLLRTYSFLVPEALVPRVRLGQRVRVGLGRGARPTPGFVVGLTRESIRTTLHPVLEVIDEETYLDANLIALGRRLAAHYATGLGLVLKAMAPEAVRRERGLRAARFVRRVERPPGGATGGAETSSPDRRARMTPQRRAVLEALDQAGAETPLDALREHVGVSDAVLRAMARDRLIEMVRRKVLSPTEEGAARHPRIPDFTLTDAQSEALQVIAGHIERGGFFVTLLHGVSGSGKTEVYVHAIRAAVARGRQAILLVPEIVLTMQLVGRLAARFDRVAVMHSGLTEAQRSVTWRRIASGDADVVIGTRSAVFAPCPRLGLICVDEEQESSYKNLQSPRFHVRDAAIMRGHQLGVAVVLGSATPSLETWFNSASRREYARVVLPRRVADRPMPEMSVVDMNVEAQALGRENVVFSRLLERKLREALERGEQSLLLLNRRGYATRLWCPQCRESVQCPRCSLPLIAHEARGQAVCHHCYSRIDLPRTCPSVGCAGALIRVGLGTQKVEEALKAHFPEARVRRADSDTMHHRDEYVRLVEDVERRRVDVLLGTQMIAKGLDFPFVSLVGVLAAESITATADFRNPERYFQLITQVAGRAGRGDFPGEVIVQTTLPQLPALRFARRGDYEAFAEHELAMRARLGYPPCRRLARGVVTHAREETALEHARTLATALREGIVRSGASDADVLGPAPCARLRLRDRYRYEFLLRASSATDLQTLLAGLQAHPEARAARRGMIIDVDPVNFD